MSKRKSIDPLARGLSIVSVILVAISVYFQFFHHSEELYARMSNLSFDNDSLELKLVIVNSGTHQALLEQINIVWTIDTTDHLSGWQYSDTVSVSPKLPVIIHPRSLVLLVLKSSFIPKNHHVYFRKPTTGGLAINGGLNDREGRLALYTAAIDSRGNKFVTITPRAIVLVDTSHVVGHTIRNPSPFNLLVDTHF